MESILYVSSYVLSTFFELYIISKFMNMFLGVGNKEKGFLYAAYFFRFFIYTVQHAYMPHGLLNILTGAVTLFVITLCYGGNISKKIITIALIFVCLFASEIVVAAAAELADVNLHNDDVFSYIGTTISLWVIYQLIRIFKNINMEIVIPKLFDIIIVALSIIIFSMETIIFSDGDIVDSIKIISVICMLMVLFLIIYLYDILSKYYEEKIQSEINKREKNYYMKQVELLEQSNKEIRALRHDMKNHLYAITAMIGNENEKAKKYIENITEQVGKIEIYSSTGNVALDSVINHKLSQANKLDIRIDSIITIPSNIQENIEDLVSIIGNLLDNAIEASENLSEEKYIEMKIKYKRGTMFIEVKNRFDGIIKQKNGEIITKKSDKAFHGIGLKRVSAAVDEHDGTIKIDFDEKEFRVSVMLYI